MSAILISLCLIAHGLLHVAIYATPPDPARALPFEPSRSWLLAGHGVDAASTRGASIALALATAAAYASAGWMLIVDAGWAGPALVGAVTGLGLKSVWFHPWLSFGIAIDVAVLAAVLGGWPA